MDLNVAVDSGVTCPYCDKKVNGSSVPYGGEVMHPSCYTEFGAEMERLYPADLDAETAVDAAALRFCEIFQLGESDESGCVSDLPSGDRRLAG